MRRRRPLDNAGCGSPQGCRGGEAGATLRRAPLSLPLQDPGARDLPSTIRLRARKTGDTPTKHRRSQTQKSGEKPSSLKKIPLSGVLEEVSCSVPREAHSVV